MSVAGCSSEVTTEVLSTDKQGAAISQKVHYFRQKKLVPLDETLSVNLRDDLTALLASCAFRSKKRVLENEWQPGNFKGETLHLTLNAAETVSSHNGQAITFSEILLSLPNQKVQAVQQDKPDQTLVYARNLQTLYSPFFGCDQDLLNKIRESLP